MAHTDLPLEQLRTFSPPVREPADFDEFWATTVAQARAHGGEVTLEKVAPGLEHVDVFDMTFPGFDGHPIKAWYSRPAGVSADLPVVVQFVGYGGGRGMAFDHTYWPSAGYAHVVMDNRGQGSSWGNGGHTEDPVGAGVAHPGYMTRGVRDPHEYFFRRLFTDAVRAVDAARTLPGVDGNAVVVCGASQGGAMALAVAGLVPDLVAVMADVAFMCHVERGVSMSDADPYGEVRRYLSIHRGDDDLVFDTLSYFDGVNFSKRARARSLWSVGLMDVTCPPSTTFAAFNAYGAAHGGADAGVAKEMAVYPYNGHEGGQGHHTQLQWEFVRSALGAA